jgi:hypothetical protein
MGYILTGFKHIAMNAKKHILASLGMLRKHLHEDCKCPLFLLSILFYILKNG